MNTQTANQLSLVCAFTQAARWLVFLMGGLLATGFVAGCTKPSTKPQERDAKVGSAAQVSSAASTAQARGTQSKLPQDLVVSNYPLYLLAKAATQDVEAPSYLLAKQEAGHHMALKPSVHQKIQHASRIVWFGVQLEAPLAKALKQAHTQDKTIALLTVTQPLVARDLQLKPTSSIDPHIWLAPERAKAIVALIAEDRAAHYPEKKAYYESNSRAFAQRMDAAVLEVAQLAAEHGSQPKAYFAYHDAYQYLESILPMRLAGALVNDPELPVSAKQLHWLASQRAALANKTQDGSVCVLGEGEASVQTLRGLEPYHRIVVDESMSSFDDFVVAWQSLATDVTHCLYKK